MIPRVEPEGMLLRKRYPPRITSGAGFFGIMRYALPIKMPARNTSVPPSTTWNAADRNGVSM